jgi:putative ABC transport system permease protein
MDWKPEIRRQLAGSQLESPRAAAIIEELAEYLDDCYAELIAGGATEAEAERRALMELSGSSMLRRELRRLERQARNEPIVRETNRRSSMIAGLRQDLRQSARILLKRPGFSLIVLLTLALGIGANTAIFSVVNAVLLRPMPYRDSDRLVTLSTHMKEGLLGNTGYATLADWRERSRSFEQLVAIRSWGGTLTGQGEPEVVRGLRVSADYFKMLGVSSMIGRDFRPEDDRPSTRFVVVIGQSLWQRRFNSDPQVIGRQLILSDVAFTIVGVMPPEFSDLLAANFYEGAEIWGPLGYDLTQPFACRNCQHLKAIARLKPDVTLEQARAEMSGIMKVMAQDHPKIYATPQLLIARLQDQFTAALRPALYLLLGAVGLVLLIACANIANLLLARASERSKEMAIRLALGAGQWRVVRQLLVESLLLAFLGSSFGLLLALWGTRLLIGLSPAKMLQLQPVSIDARVLLFTLLISLLTGLLFGLAPAWQASRQDMQLALKESSKSSSGKKQQRLRESCVVIEIVFAMVLLVGAGLLMRSLVQVLETKPGFESRNLLTLVVPAASAKKYKDDAQVRDFYQEVIRKIEALPGVEAAGIVSNLPFGGNMDMSGFHIEEKPLANPAEAPSAERYGVSPDYLRAMGIPLLRGRGVTAEDRATTPLVVLINQTAAQRLWPNEDPLGKRIRLGGANDSLRSIIGIVGDVNHYDLETAPDLQAYVPHAQWTDSNMLLVLRTSIEPGALTGPVRAAIHAIDPDAPLYKISTMRELISTSTAQRRFTLLLLAVFAAVALLMAAVGLYGVMAYNVTQRTREIGIRIALGAQSTDVQRLIIGRGVKLVLIGVALGSVAALGLTQLMTKLLFEVRATDPLTFVGIALLLVLVAMLACWLSSRRVTKINPVIALRYE